MRIATWNMQGNTYDNVFSSFNEAKARMYHNNIDVFCLQEIGNIFSVLNQGEAWERLDDLSPNFYLLRNYEIHTQSRSMRVNIYYICFGDSNLRCSMAIMVKSELDTINPAYIPYNDNVRPVFGVLLNDNTAIYNIHAPSGTPYFAATVLKNTLEQIGLLKTGYEISRTFLLGDFNCQPGFLVNKNIIFENQVFCHLDQNNYPSATQRSGNCLDFGVTLEPGRYNVKPEIEQNAAFSDHIQVTFEIIEDRG